MQQRITSLREKKREKREKPCSKGAQHPRNLDPPLPTCYLPAEAFSFLAFGFFSHLTREGDALRCSPEVT
jgi:hypothetical protein